MLVILTLFPFVQLVTLAWGSSTGHVESNSPVARRDASANTHSVQLTRRKTPLLASLARTRGKYGFATAAKRARRRRAVDDIPLTEDAADLSYAATATVGGQTLELVLDTGSADLVVATHDCTDCEASVYDPNSSSTADVTQTDFSITYGTGSASGVLVSDTVALGSFSIASQTFGACDDFENLLGGSESGLLGLAWQSLSMSEAVPFAQNLWQSGQLDSPVFGLALRSGSGTLTLGGVDSAATAEDINYIDLVDSGSYWQVPLEGVRVNGVDVGVSSKSAIIDSGTSLVSVPAAAVSSIYAAISAEARAVSGLMVYPCSANATVELSFGGVWYTIPSDSFSYGQRDSAGTECWGSVYDASEGTSDLFIVGGAFLQHVYSAFRFDPPAVGFANLAADDSPAAAPSQTVQPSIVLPDVASTVPLVATVPATDSSVSAPSASSYAEVATSSSSSSASATIESSSNVAMTSSTAVTSASPAPSSSPSLDTANLPAAAAAPTDTSSAPSVAIATAGLSSIAFAVALVTSFII